MRRNHDPRIIEAATSVFLRYGFRKTTMGDLAQAAGLSRPALYLRYCNKEQVFEAVLGTVASRILGEIRAGLSHHGTALEKLRFAFDRWAVQPFRMMQGSPEAKDLMDCALSFAGEAVARNQGEFEEILVSILESIEPPGGADGPTRAQTAHLLAVSVHGFKTAARDEAELQSMIDAMLKLVFGNQGA